MDEIRTSPLTDPVAGPHVSEVVLTYVDGHVERIPCGPNGVVLGEGGSQHVLRIRGIDLRGNTAWTRNVPTMSLRSWWTERGGRVT